MDRDRREYRLIAFAVAHRILQPLRSTGLADEEVVRFVMRQMHSWVRLDHEEWIRLAAALLTEIRCDADTRR
ncbi:MAG: hypothetical protein M3176_06075 [Chloroflexota bacterium]|nr:hypothetical protein [Chloroflexota bacterium]